MSDLLISWECFRANTWSAFASLGFHLLICIFLSFQNRSDPGRSPRLRASLLTTQSGARARSLAQLPASLDFLIDLVSNFDSDELE